MLLVTGAAGMAGWHVITEALHRNLPVSGLWHNEQPVSFGADVPMHRCDLLDYSKCADLVANLRPTAVVHCAALTNVDACEDNLEHTMNVNAHASGALAEVAAECGARFIYFSSDSVYEGSRPNWRETDPANPVNAYAKSKKEAGRRILAAYPEAVVLRTNFYGKHPCDDRALASWILGRLETGQDVPGFTDVVFSPLWIGHLAQRVVDLATEEKYADVSGLLNLGGDGSISKYDFARQMAQAAGHDPDRVKTALSTDIDFKAARPLDTSMDVGRARDIFGTLPTMGEGLEAFVKDLEARKNVS